MPPAVFCFDLVTFGTWKARQTKTEVPIFNFKDKKLKVVSQSGSPSSGLLFEYSTFEMLVEWSYTKQFETSLWWNNLFFRFLGTLFWIALCVITQPQLHQKWVIWRLVFAVKTREQAEVKPSKRVGWDLCVEEELAVDKYILSEM